MDEDIDVNECLRRWKQGDEAAAETLIGHLYPIISRIVRTHLPRRDDEKDLVQEILMKTFSRLHQFKVMPPSRIGSRAWPSRRAWIASGPEDPTGNPPG